MGKITHISTSMRKRRGSFFIREGDRLLSEEERKECQSLFSEGRNKPCTYRGSGEVMKEGRQLFSLSIGASGG